MDAAASPYINKVAKRFSYERLQAYPRMYGATSDGYNDESSCSIGICGIWCFIITAGDIC